MPADGPLELKLSYAPREYGRDAHGLLEVTSEERQWVYTLRGSVPKYKPPKGEKKVSSNLDEQTAKAERLAALGAALHVERQPGDLAGWQAILEQARQLDIDRLQPLHDPRAAEHAAGWLEATADRLWDSESGQTLAHGAVIDLGRRRLPAEPNFGPISGSIPGQLG